MCDKSRNTWLCVHWQWNTLEWCQLNALQASPVVHLVTPLPCVSLSMNTQPSVPTIETRWINKIWMKDLNMFITRVSEVIMFSPCVFVTLFVSLSRCLSGRFNYEGLVPHKQYFAGTLLGMSSCASYVSRTHDVIDDVTRSQNRSNFEIDISPSIFELERRSKAQNVGNAHGYLSGIFNFRYNFR